jgi:hypothetical protein
MATRGRCRACTRRPALGEGWHASGTVSETRKSTQLGRGSRRAGQCGGRGAARHLCPTQGRRGAVIHTLPLSPSGMSLASSPIVLRACSRAGYRPAAEPFELPLAWSVMMLLLSSLEWIDGSTGALEDVVYMLVRVL